MSPFDWLLFVYIFKWADFWIAPTWVFVTFWILTALTTLASLYND